MKVDHVSIAWSNLEALQAAFESVGLKTDYGGVHSNGVTHMSLLAFDDGSYIELISTIKPGAPSPSWGKQVAENGGPCAWCIEVDDLASEVARVKNLGIAAVGPLDYFRRRPDGVLVEWQLAFIGDKEPGATLPFLIKDKTPREYRVKPSPSVSSSLGKGESGTSARLSGVEKVVLGVRDLENVVDLIRKLYGWKEPSRSTDFSGDLQGITFAEFDSTLPVVLASPLRKGTWLDRRLEQFGDSPCAFLIGTSDLSQTINRYDLTDPQPWFSRPRNNTTNIAWIPPSKLLGIKLGFIG